MTIRAAFPVVSAIALLMFLSAAPLWAQDGTESDPGSALAAALSAACRANEPHFANYLTQHNAAAFKALPADQRTSLLQRFSLVGEAGKPLLDSDRKITSSFAARLRRPPRNFVSAIRAFTRISLSFPSTWSMGSRLSSVWSAKMAAGA